MLGFPSLLTLAESDQEFDLGKKLFKLCGENKAKENQPAKSFDQPVTLPVKTALSWYR